MPVKLTRSSAKAINSSDLGTTKTYKAISIPKLPTFFDYNPVDTDNNVYAPTFPIAIKLGFENLPVQLAPHIYKLMSDAGIKESREVDVAIVVQRNTKTPISRCQSYFHQDQLNSNITDITKANKISITTFDVSGNSKKQKTLEFSTHGKESVLYSGPSTKLDVLQGNTSQAFFAAYTHRPNPGNPNDYRAKNAKKLCVVFHVLLEQKECIELEQILNPPDGEVKIINETQLLTHLKTSPFLRNNHFLRKPGGAAKVSPLDTMQMMLHGCDLANYMCFDKAIAHHANASTTQKTLLLTDNNNVPVSTYNYFKNLGILNNNKVLLASRCLEVTKLNSEAQIAAQLQGIKTALQTKAEAVVAIPIHTNDHHMALVIHKKNDKITVYCQNSTGVSTPRLIEPLKALFGNANVKDLKITQQYGNRHCSTFSVYNLGAMVQNILGNKNPKVGIIGIKELTIITPEQRMADSKKMAVDFMEQVNNVITGAEQKLKEEQAKKLQDTAVSNLATQRMMLNLALDNAKTPEMIKGWLHSTKNNTHTAEAYLTYLGGRGTSLPKAVENFNTARNNTHLTNAQKGTDTTLANVNTQITAAIKTAKTKLAQTANDAKVAKEQQQKAAQAKAQKAKAAQTKLKEQQRLLRETKAKAAALKAAQAKQQKAAQAKAQKAAALKLQQQQARKKREETARRLAEEKQKKDAATANINKPAHGLWGEKTEQVLGQQYGAAGKEYAKKYYLYKKGRLNRTIFMRFARNFTGCDKQSLASIRKITDNLPP